MNKLIVILLLSLLILANLANGEDILAQTDFIKQAIENNPSYQISVQDYLIALEQDKSVRSLEDWNLIISGLWSESTPPPVSTFSSEYQKTTGYTVGLEKYIANTGTDIKLEHSNTRIESRYPPPVTIPGIGTFDFNPPSDYYLSSVSLQVTQPLLKNAFGLVKKNALKMSAYSLKLAEIKLSEDWEDFISSLHGEYLTWQKYWINVELIGNKVTTVKEQLALVRKQFRYGLSEDLDVVQLEQKLEGYKIMLEQAKMACDIQTKKIFHLMNAGTSYVNMKPEKFVSKGLVMDESTANSYLSSDSNVKKTADIMVELQSTNLETKENAKQMDVRLVLSTRPNAFTEQFGDSLSKIGQYNENTISITAKRALSNDRAVAEAEQAGIEYNKALKERENIMLNAGIGLSSLYTNFKRLSNMIKLNENNLKLAKRRLVLERKKFNQGRSSIFFVLQAEDDVLQAENSLNETIFAREEIINQIKTLTDQYLVEYKDVLKL